MNELKRIMMNGVEIMPVPVGMISAFGGGVAPVGWLICDGQEVSREIYSSLFSVIGTSFGQGDGENTFNVPDLRESVPKGTGLTGKSVNHYNDTGLSLGEFIDDRFQAHQHYLGKRDDSSGTNTDKINPTDASTSHPIHSYRIVKYNNEMGDPRYGNTTEVKSVGVNYIIKY